MKALSGKVDLTEHRDFGVESTSFGISGMDIEISGRNDTEMFMTSDEYDKMMRIEGIFGKRTHRDEYFRVFRKEWCEFENDMIDHCDRCGRYISHPWKRGLCEQCIKEMRRMRKVIPWVDITAQDGDAKDIFNMR